MEKFQLLRRVPDTRDVTRVLANQRAAKLATNWRPRNGRVMMRIAWLHCGSIWHVIRLSATVRHVRGKMGFFGHGTNVNPLDINKSLLQKLIFEK